MGAVYQAWDAELGLSVALKVIRPAARIDPIAAQTMERRFKQELLLARQVTHRNVVRIHDMGEVRGIKYITMPFIEGEDLSKIIGRQARLPIHQVLRIARSVVSGLAAAHAAGIVHRDLKPANIMIAADGEAMIMDFGIARSMTDSGTRSDGTGHTLFGAVVGTTAYMAPEQARAEPVDQRADIYAFGLILYDLVLGRTRMIAPNNAVSELHQRMMAPPPEPHAVDPDVPRSLSRVINRCLQPDPAARYTSSAELAADLDRLDDDGNPLPIARRLTGRMAAAAATLVLSLLGATWWLAREPTPTVTHEPVSVLIADFNNLAQDKSFEGALEGALGIAVEGAPFITAYPRTDARKIATDLTGRPVLDEYAARLVAAREGITMVLAGTVALDAGKYHIGVTGRNTDGGELWTERRTVRSRADLLGAVAAVASDIRTTLGDTAMGGRPNDTEFVTTSSLEALQNYTAGQELYAIGKFDDAVKQYETSIAQDPKFGRAYAGLANALFYMGRKTDAERNWQTALSLMDQMTEREKYRTQGTYFLGVARNYEKAIDTYETLTKQYPTDSSGLNNLAIAYFMVLNFPKALENGRRVLDLYPKSVLFRNNYALYAMYAGDFATATRESEPLLKAPGPHPFFKIYLPPAIAAAVNNETDAAIALYTTMAETGAQAKSLAEVGLADLAIYRGRYSDAEAILEEGMKVDESSGNSAGLAVKQVMLGEVYAATGRMPLALAAVSSALKLQRGESVLVPAAQLYIAADKMKEAKALTAELNNPLQKQNRAYAKIIDARIATLSKQPATALDTLHEATKLADLWLARYQLGLTYAQAGAWSEALSEFAMCEKRRGEATALFLDDVPTIRYLAALPYWLGRAQEGLGQHGVAHASFHRFLSIRGANLPDDPLVIDARRRVGS